MAEDQSGLTSLEPLNRKPVLWRGLTSDELGLMLGLCVVAPVVVFVLIFAFVWIWAAGLIVGLLFGAALFLIASGYIEKQKKKHGSAQFWIYLKKQFQSKGLMNFGYETDKKKWGATLTRPRKRHPRVRTDR